MSGYIAYPNLFSYRTVTGGEQTLNALRKKFPTYTFHMRVMSDFRYYILAVYTLDNSVRGFVKRTPRSAWGTAMLGGKHNA